MDEKENLRKEFLETFPKIQNKKRKGSNDDTDQILQKMMDADKDEDLGYGISKEEAKKLKKEVLDSESPHQYVIDNICKEIEEGIHKLNFKNPMYFYATEIPTGQINASVMKSQRIKNGAIIFMNSGLMQLISQTTKIMMHRLLLGKKENDGRPYFDETELEEKQITNLLAKIFEAYLKYNDITKAPQYEQLGGVKTLLAGSVIGGAEKFIIGHEYAHGVLGHLENPKNMRAMSVKGKEVQIVDESFKNEEYEADSVGLTILFKTLSNTNDREITFFEQSGASIGPFLFFSLAELDFQIQKDVLNTKFDESTHPPNSLRAKKLRKNIEERTNKEYLKFADVCSEWILEKQDGIISILKKNL